MKKYSILFLTLCLSLQLNAQSPTKKYVVISEVMYDTPLNEVVAQGGISYSNGEYIELFNLENTAVDLTGWQLTLGNSTSRYAFPANTIIKPKSCIIIAYQHENSRFSLRALYTLDPDYEHTILYQRNIILSNSGGTVSIVDNTGRIIDYITYDGTSNATKPDRLSAPNANDLPGNSCKSLNRTRVLFDSSGNIIFSPSHWITDTVSPSEAHIDSPLDQPTEYKNYVLETVYTSPDTGTNTITYYDGFGRPSQIINVGCSPSQQQNVVAFIEYDCMGRSDSISYLPYVATSQSTQFRQNPLEEQQNFYKNGYKYDFQAIDRNYAFARKEYDKSALGITLKEGAPGRAHQLNSHPTVYEYGFNGPWGTIRKYAVADNGDLIYDGVYATKQLTTKVTKQPTIGSDNITTIEYFDKDGITIAREQHISSSDRRIIYYVHDDLGRQRYILPPSVDITANTALSQLTDNCFYTEYDEYGRVFKQYVPGASYILSLYDKRGRLAMRQDGEQRKTAKWSYTKYDKFDRPVMTGIYSGGTYESHKAALESQTIFGETTAQIGYGYTNKCYPTVDYNNVLTVFYYDDYLWIEMIIGDDTYNFRSDLALGNKQSSAQKGQLTGKMVRVLDPENPSFMYTVNYYDDKYRVIQTVGDLYPEGTEVVSNAYDYTGNVTHVQVRQITPSGTHEYRKKFIYDQQSRLLSIAQQITGDKQNGWVTVARYIYDAMGRMTEKKLHNGKEKHIFNYDIEGKNTINASYLFGNNIYTSLTDDDTPPRYDGKPVHCGWHRPNTPSLGYKYTYDQAGQIIAAKYIEYSQDERKWISSSAFNEQNIKYDKNGNILQLSRTDENGNTLHNLTYTYRGNQLTKLNCNGVDYSGYTYDACGNLTSDPYNKVGIEYNELNLPLFIFSTNKDIKYIYDAEGQKLGSISNDGSFTYYRSVMVYGGTLRSSPEQLLYILHPEGIATKTGVDTYDYKYFITDYTGNVRTVAVADNASKTLLEEQATDYYPFGLAHNYNNLHKNRYLFSGKELQDASVGRDNFLGLYDFGARYYNPTLARWFNIDPALQTTNPYIFCGNAPTVFVDKDGRLFFTILNAIKDFFSDWSFHSTKMAWRIDAGLFKGNIWKILSRFTWELPQTLFGYIGSQAYNLVNGVKSVSYYGGATAVQSYSSGWGAFTLGSYVIGSRSLYADPNNTLFQHEYGHYLQSQASGPLYLTKYAIPSLYDAAFGKDKTHDYHPVEQDANARAIKYFEKKIPGFADLYNDDAEKGWDHLNNPIVGYDTKGGFNTPASQAALNRAIMPAFENVGDVFISILSSVSPITALGTGLAYESIYNDEKRINLTNPSYIVTR